MRLKTTLVTAVAAFSLLAAGAPATAAASDARGVSERSLSDVVSVNVKHERGKEVFAALFFAEGPLAAELSELPEFAGMKQFLANRDRTSQAGGVKSFLAQVEVDHPRFFADFYSEMTSANPFQVEKAMEEGTEIVASHVRAQSINPQSPLWVVVALAAGHSIAAVSGAVLVVAVAAVYGATLFWPNSGGEPVSQTQVEVGLARVIGVLDKHYG